MSERRLRCRPIAALLIAALASGCGFHLQNSLTLPASMERTYVRTADTHSQFYWALRQRLELAGVEVVETEQEATAVFAIYSDITDQRVLSVSARNVPTEYEVYYTVRYGIVAGEETLVPVQELTRTHDYTYDPTLVLGKEHEEQLLRDRLSQDLARIALEKASVR